MSVRQTNGLKVEFDEITDVNLKAGPQKAPMSELSISIAVSDVTLKCNSSTQKSMIVECFSLFYCEINRLNKMFTYMWAR